MCIAFSYLTYLKKANAFIRRRKKSCTKTTNKIAQLTGSLNYMQSFKIKARWRKVASSKITV